MHRLEAEVDVEWVGDCVVGDGLDGELSPQRRAVLVHAHVGLIMDLLVAVCRRGVELLVGVHRVVVLPARASAGCGVVVVVAASQQAPLPPHHTAAYRKASAVSAHRHSKLGVEEGRSERACEDDGGGARERARACERERNRERERERERWCW